MENKIVSKLVESTQISISDDIGEQITFEETEKMVRDEKVKKLEEEFKKADNTYNDYINLKIAIEIFLRENKDNEVLQEYMKLLEQKEDLENDMVDYKKTLYETMNDTDIDIMEGKVIELKIKRPYTKQTIDTKAFVKDNPEGSKLYNKYVSVTSVKGNAIIKLLTEEDEKKSKRTKRKLV